MSHAEHAEPAHVAEATGSAASAPEPPRFDVRRRAVESLVLVASVVSLRLVGVVLLAISAGSTDLLLGIIAAVADLQLLVWAGLVAAVQYGLREMRRPGRWTFVVLAAPVAVLLATAVRSLPGIMIAGPGAVLGNGIAWLDATIFTVVVALGVTFASAFLSRERRAMGAVAGGLLALGGLLTLVLVWQGFQTYFRIWGGPVVATQAQEDRYLVTATFTLAAYVGAIVLAAASRRRGLIITASVVGCLGLIVAFAVQVPTGRFIPDPPPPPAERPYAPCYGEGDPNCVGG